MAHHRDIVLAIYQLLTVQLNVFILDPVDPANPEQMGTWLYQHQQMHNEMDALFGIAGANLTQLNWSDPSGVSNWMQQNFNEHFLLSNILGIY